MRDDIIVLADSKDREAWLAARRKVLSASDVASVLGFGYTSRNKVLAEKGAGVVDKSDDVSGFAQVEAGSFMEPAVAAWFGKDHGSVEGCGQLMARKERPWVAATPDFILNGKTPVEVKCVGFETRANWHVNSTPTKGWPEQFPLPVPVDIKTRYPTQNLRVAAADLGTPRGLFREAVQELYKTHLPALGAPCAPVKYWCQLQVQMYVLGEEHGWVTVAIGGTCRIDLLYRRDEEFLAYWLGEAETFWGEVLEAKLALEGL